MESNREQVKDTFSGGEVSFEDFEKLIGNGEQKREQSESQPLPGMETINEAVKEEKEKLSEEQQKQTESKSDEKDQASEGEDEKAGSQGEGHGEASGGTEGDPESSLEEKQTEGDLEKPSREEGTFFKTVENLIDLGIVDDVEIGLSEDSEDSIKLSDFKDITREQFTDIMAQIDEAKKTQEEQKLEEGLTEEQKSIVNAMRNGADISEFYNPQQGVNLTQNPLDNIDRDDENVRKGVYMQYYTAQMGGDANAQKKAARLMQGAMQDGSFDEEVDTIFSAYEQSYKTHIKSIEEKYKKEAEAEKERVKTVRKNLSSVLKENKFKDNTVRKIVDGITKPNEEGLLPIEQKFEEILSDPEKHYRVLLHMMDEGTFDKHIGEKISTKASSIVLRGTKDLTKSGQRIKKVETEPTGPGLDEINNQLKVMLKK